MADPAELAVGFARVLRGAGLDVPIGAVLTFSEALAQVGVDERDRVYWSGRATLLRKPEDIGIYDQVFATYWERRAVPVDLAPRVEETITIAMDDGTDDDGSDQDDESSEINDDPTITVRFSTHEVLRHKDFALYTQDELHEARRLMGDLRLSGALRRCRRKVPSKRAYGEPDLRRTVRAALKAGGEPMRRLYREQGERPRRLVLLCDVSGSMEPYARALMRFLHAAVVGRTKVEAFALGTRLTRITRELSSRDPDRALSAAAKSVVDWSGGTRLGDGLKLFNDEWGVRGMARGAIVVILSDGWDRGEPTVMAEQMSRLHRVAYKVVWVNPLKATPGYMPLARGMAAALPYIDDFVEGHSLAAMQELAEVISR
ncbi:MAG: VWA domain-containing protein [Acidimicrobiia bacterium]